MQFEVTQWNDAQLLSEVRQRIKDDNYRQAEFLVLLGEIDVRTLYAGLGYSSLFAYCTQALGLSEGSAYRRIHAARAARQFPVIYDLIATGETHCAAVSMIRPHLTAQNAADLLQRICRKSKREVEQLIAALAPKPDVVDSARKLPATNNFTCPGASCGNSLNADTPPTNHQTFNCLVVDGDGQNQPVFPTAIDKIVPLAPARIKFQFTASEEFRDKFEQAKALLWHTYPAGQFEDIFAAALDALLDKKDPSRKIPRDKTSHSTGRYIPRQVKHQVWERDQGCCQFVGQQGKRCGTQVGLEFDHVTPFTLGGRSDDPQNIRLLCQTHNQWRTRALG